ncbi:MAG: AraC family transcriptional regulator [Oculatellaceae cyanobacterium bins.114]|nr:AraC family transcriptional regulator [Oculatellaceae cyanobacterium bins.114]
MAVDPLNPLSLDDAVLPIAPPVWGRRFESDRLFIELCPKQPYQVRYQPDWHILGFSLESQTGSHAFASDRITAYHAPANTFAFTPATCETFSESIQGGAYLICAVSPGLFDTYVDDIGDHRLAHPSLALRRLSHCRNRHVTAIARATQQFMQTHPSGGRLYLEALAGQFVTHVILALLAKSEVTTPPDHLNGLAFDQLLEFVETHLCEDLSLAVLAEVVGMSPSQFVRSFKATVGQSPHAWVIMRRLGRAKALLAQSKQSITQIALDCGFSSQSHMTMLFSKQLGVTPRQYRTEVRE